MKVNALVVFGLILFGLSGCSGDEGPSTQNSIKLSGQKFNVTVATITGVAIDGEGHAGISFSHVTNTSSKTLNIDIEYAGDSDVSGTYSYPQTGENGILIEGLTNYTEMNMEGDFYTAELVSGTVTVEKNSAGTYTVVMNLNMVDDKVFSGTYKGKFVTQFSNQ